MIFEQFAKNLKRGDLIAVTTSLWGKRSQGIYERREAKKLKLYEEIKRYRELSIAEKKRIRDVERFKFLKREAKLMDKRKRKGI
ncbi:MAG: hypothetical protein H7Y18_07800 [Clostridiaceae bacterium]|nr:hypothetical protein [Clostridiaceae bacterium]